MIALLLTCVGFLIGYACGFAVSYLYRLPAGLVAVSRPHLPGFGPGILHGFFLVATVAGRFRDPRLMPYEPENTGFSYDVGFFLGVGLFWGSLFLLM